MEEKPRLAENKDIVTYIVEEGVKRGYSFVAVTNGYEVDAFLDLPCTGIRYVNFR